MLPRLERLDGDFCMPVVGGGDHDRVDIVPVENTAVIGIDVGKERFITAPHDDTFLVHHLADVVVIIQIAQGGHIGELTERIGVPAPLSPDTDGSHPQSGRLLASEFGKTTEPQRGGRAGGALKKDTAFHGFFSLERTVHTSGSSNPLR